MVTRALTTVGVVLTLALLCALGGCKGNYTFTDSDYRPLGDPHAINRGK